MPVLGNPLNSDTPSYFPGSALHRYDPRSNSYNVTATSTLVWRKALTRMRNGGQPARISMYGDSNVAGYNATGTDGHLVSPMARARQVLLSRFPNLFGEGMSWMVGTGGSSYLDGRFTFGTDWAHNGSTGIGAGNQLGFTVNPSTVSSGIMSWAPGFSADTFNLVYRQASAVPGGTFDVWLDSGSHTSATTVGAGATVAVRQALTGTLAAHTLNVQPTQTGKYYTMFGVEAYDSTTPRILLSHNGVFGTKAGQWNTETLEWPATIGPDLTIVLLGHNDLNGTGGGARTAAQFISDMTTLATAARAQGGDLALVGYHPGYRSPYDWISSGYSAAYYTLADTLNVPLLDMQARWGESYTTANSRGLVGTNDAHVTDAGSWDYAQALSDFIVACGI